MQRQKTNGPSNNRLLRKKRIKNAPQPSANSRPLRRNTRITARQKVLKTVPTQSRVAKSSPRRLRQRIYSIGTNAFKTDNRISQLQG